MFYFFRYRSAYVKHREQNHRARLPADKLFTCDVCGMQFRYLKSFKKHRLNHALERIHGKHEKKAATTTSSSSTCGDGSEAVSSSNETLMLNEENVDLKGMIKEEDEEEDQDDTIDSVTKEDHHHQPMMMTTTNIIVDEQQQPQQPKITSSEMDISNLNLMIPKVSKTRMKLGSSMWQRSFDQLMYFAQPMPESSSSAMPTTSLSNLMRPDAAIGLNPQEASLLNFLRADAVDKQRERR